MEAIKKKYEGLKARLAEAESKASKAEAELESINEQVFAREQDVIDGEKEVEQLQNDLEEYEEKISFLLGRLLEAEKNLEESVRAVSVLQNRTGTDGRKHGRLESELEKVVTRNEEVVDELEKTTQTIEELECKIEDADDRYATASEKIKEMEADCTRITHDLQRMKVSEGKATQGQEHSSSRIEQLTADCEAMEERATRGEEKVKAMEIDLAEKEDQVQDAIREYNEAKALYDSSLAELAEM